MLLGTQTCRMMRFVRPQQGKAKAARCSDPPVVNQSTLAPYYLHELH